MKLITPPKLVPPCHSAAASGDVAMKQTKLIRAMNGPTTAFSRSVQMPWPWTKKACQNAFGTSVARNPAPRKSDHHFPAEHGQVGDGIAGRVRPASRRP